MVVVLNSYCAILGTVLQPPPPAIDFCQCNQETLLNLGLSINSEIIPRIDSNIVILRCLDKISLKQNII